MPRSSFLSLFSSSGSFQNFDRIQIKSRYIIDTIVLYIVPINLQINNGVLYTYILLLEVINLAANTNCTLR